jgi:hypothetical protein
MAYFPDLSPYAYGGILDPGVVHVGWLVDGTHPFPKGSVESRLIEKMKLLAEKLVELYLGKHICELCKPSVLLNTTMAWEEKYWEWADQRSSNDEIRVACGGVRFAAPVLIVHYIEEDIVPNAASPYFLP